MCGLVGMAGEIAPKHKEVFQDLLDICQLRGRDSTGVIAVSNQRTYDYCKEIGPPTYLFETRKYEEVVDRKNNHAAIIGHCRHKTVGQVNRRNAHPFDFPDEKIIGVHNGTLRATNKLDTHHYQLVDSEILYGHLAKNGPQDTFDRTEGAWACVWWDGNNNTINFIRNDQRPLWFTWSEDRKVMFWASEAWFFMALARKKDVGLWDGGKEENVYVELPTNTLWSFEVQKGVGKDKLKFKTPVVIENKPLPVGNFQRPWEKQNQSSLASSAAGSNNKGGEVSNPFLPKNDNGSLDDQLPEELRPEQGVLVEFPVESSTSKPSTNASTKSSKKSSESPKLLTATTSGSPNTGSKRQKNSTLSLKTNKKNRSNEQEKSHFNRTSPLIKKQGTDVRFIPKLGTCYITDNKSGIEYSEEQVAENTDNCCSSCGQTVENLEEIHEFFGKNRFICTSCLQPEFHLEDLVKDLEIEIEVKAKVNKNG